MSKWGLYVHIPWCKTRCPYCAFNTYVDKAPPFEAYTEALIAQWGRHYKDFNSSPSTVFFGGGTPSLHPPELIQRLLGSFGPSKDAEITLEANPGTVNLERLNAYKKAGINRVSLGVQTFQRQHAAFLNRGHSVNEAAQLLEDVAEAGFDSWNADLMFALPHQSLASFQEDLEALIDCQPPHISLYGLSAEDGTPYTRALQAGRLPTQDEELWENMMDHAETRLHQAGWERYEVSNWSKPGERARHNSLYWQGAHWMGLGAGAHGWHPQGTRTVGHKSPKNFIQSPTTWAESYTPSAHDTAVDLILSCIRHKDGISLQKLHDWGFDIEKKRIQNHLDSGLLAWSENRIRVQSRGWKLINSLVIELESALQPLGPTA